MLRAALKRLALILTGGALVGLCVLSAGAAGALSPQKIAVIYPDVAEPYRSAFSLIIDGIEDTVRSRVASFPVGADVNPKVLADELRRREIRVVITLGRNSLKLLSGLESELGVVAGGVVNLPEAEARNLSVFSLSPDPALLFDRLKVLLPHAKKVYVVYDPRQNAWLIRLASDAAKSRGLELVALEASDIKTAARYYQEYFASADPKKDALWLPQDATTVEETSILPMILDEGWKRAFPIFSSNLAHVRRGALFALYPNNFQLGRSLAGAALGKGSANAESRTAPLRDVLSAINVRTADHLGIAYKSQQGFDTTFPTP